MSTERGQWMLAALPAVYADCDEASGGELNRLLDALATLFFDGGGLPQAPVSGLEAQIHAIPALFLPLGDTGRYGWPEQRHTPDRFLPWLAQWLSFTPHDQLEPAALRRVLANIVPLYGRRGTRQYLLRLLELAFAELVTDFVVDDRPRPGFTVGRSRVGQDTRLARGEPFLFTVRVKLRPGTLRRSDAERRLCAVIDFAKPAHTRYELQIDSEPGAN
jgi:phage tail-like protein